MRNDPKQYLIALKRARRDQAPSDWVDQLREIEDLCFIGEAHAKRVLVEAPPDAIEAVRARHGDYCHVEPLIEHKPMH